MITWSAYRPWNSILQPTFTQFYWRQQWLDKVVNRPTLKRVMFCYENIRRSNFFLSTQHFLWHRECLTQLSSNAGMSVWRIVWVTKNYCFMSDIFLISPMTSEFLRKSLCPRWFDSLNNIYGNTHLNFLTIKYCPSSHFFLSGRTLTLLSYIFSSTQFVFFA